MTIQELKDHCEKQVNQCELFAKHRDEEPSGKIYEEHKLILTLINALDKVKKARDEMAELSTPPQYYDEDYYICGVEGCLEILDKILESEDK